MVRQAWAFFGLRVPLSISLVFVLSQSASAQDDFRLWLSPRPNEFSVKASATTTLYSDEDVADQDADFEAARHDLNLRVKLGPAAESEWLLSLDAESWALDTPARFDESGLGLPQELHQVAAGVTYRRLLENDWLIGQNLQLGSASDKLFDSAEEIYLRGTTFLKLPSGRYNAWLMFLNFDTHREFPVLPGLAYQAVLAENLFAVVGVPVLTVEWQPVKTTHLGLSYFPIKHLNARLTHRFGEPWTATASFQWDSSLFSRAGRDDKDDRIEFEEKRVKLELAYAFTEQLSLAAHGGYAFGRRLGEGDDYDERSENDMDIENAWFGGAELRWRL